MGDNGNKEISFPTTVTKCPSCGSEKLMTEEVKRLYNPDALKVGQELAITVVAVPVATMAQIKMNLNVPWLLIFLNVCGEPECGTVYCRRAEVSIKKAQSNPLV